jgi:hypothetical protein
VKAAKPVRIRRRLALRTIIVIFGSVLCLPLLAATANAESAIASAVLGDATCTLRVDNIHRSSTVPGDVSVHSTASCARTDVPGSRFTADLIAMETDLSYGIPGVNVLVSHCDIRKANRFSLKLPCHGNGALTGTYMATTRATITIGNITKTIKAEQLNYADFDPRTTIA